MKVSIISPSFNQCAFIQKTIDSVACQSYPDKEHILVDGGSDDGSIEIIRSAAGTHGHIKAIVEPDRGQADAINKGFRAASGDIIAWLNTDDFYADPRVLSEVVSEFQRHPEAEVIYGRGNRVDRNGVKIKEAFVNRRIHGPGDLKEKLGILQPSVFFRKSVFDRVGGLSEEYDLQLDYEYWIRLLQSGVHFHFLDRVLSSAVVHDDAKSTRDRLKQLSECISLISDKYGDVPPAWTERFCTFFVTNRDEKAIAQNKLQGSEIIRAEALQSTLEQLGAAEAETDCPRRIIVTSFDSKYFQQGLNLIASLHRTSFASIDAIYVYSLQLKKQERALLNDLEKVQVVEFPDEPPAGFPDFYAPAGRAYKVSAIAGRGLPLRSGDLVLWMDAGLTACSDVSEVFDLISEHAFFITDHDDSAAWPFFNASFIHRDAVAAIEPTPEELLAAHLCSCLVGHKVNGRFQAIIDEAYRIGLRRDAIMWPKVLGPDAKKGALRKSADQVRLERTRLLEDRERLGQTTALDVCALFPFYGHRTQSVYSILVHRYSAPVFSAKLYRKSDAKSSEAAVRNWVEGASGVDAAADRSFSRGLERSTRLFHHRGTHTFLGGIQFRTTSQQVFLVGNGPSLRGFNFEKLKPYDWIGMNAAYRYWDETGIYPTIYCCFDAVVQDSHKGQIKRLIIERGRNGIRWFFLRKSFLAYWPDSAQEAGVFFLEDLQRSVSWLDRDKITTGSFSLYVAAFLGFKQVHILGIDLNYVEQIPEAAAVGRELVISKQVSSNPNYFFDGYQQKGDRYNPPNRHKDMHLRSWAEAAQVLAPFPIDIVNCNEGSAVRDFPFQPAGKVIADLKSRHLSTLRAASLANMLMRRQEFWRNEILAAIGVPDDYSFEPKKDQCRRLGSWVSQVMGVGRGDASGPRYKQRIISVPPQASASSSRPTDARRSVVPGKSLSGTSHSGDRSMLRTSQASVNETAVVARLLSARRGSAHTMLDVGAHFGSSASYFHKLGWNIHCFEPDPKNREKLFARLGNSPNVIIDPRAVSDAPAVGVSFFTSEESTGISALHSFRETHGETGKVDVTTLAAVVDERAIETVDFLKIDVEGFDFAVLKGVPWDRVRPDVITAEFEDAKTVKLGHTYKEVCDFLVGKGYAVYLSEWHPIIRYGVPHDWRRVTRYPSELASGDAWGNLLAFREDPGLEAVRAAFEACLTFREPRPKGAPVKTVKSATRPELKRAAELSKLKPNPPNSATLASSPPVGRPNASATSVSLPRMTARPNPRPTSPASSVPLYSRFALWAETNSPLMFGLGQFAMWGARTAKRYTLASLLAMLVPLVLVVGLLVPQLIDWHSLLVGLLAAYSVIAVLVVSVGYARHLMKKLKAESAAVADLASLRESLAGLHHGNYARDLMTKLKAESMAAADLEIAPLRAELASLRESLADLKHGNSARDLMTKLKAESMAAVDLEIAPLRAELASLRESLAGLQHTNGVVSGLEGRLAGIEQAMPDIEKMREAVTATEQRLDAASVDIYQVRARMDRSGPSAFQQFNRRLSDDQLKTLLGAWAGRLQLQLKPSILRYLADRVAAIEGRMRGRLATSVEDMMLRTLVGMSVRRPTLEILEIGTLFGVGAAIMHDAARFRFERVHLTLLDPLDGYYGENRADILTGERVSEPVLLANLAAAGIPADDVTLIKNFSTEKDAIAAASARSYDVLVIDGDHTYAGVKADFDNYARLVRTGGFVIFDDYGSADWPDVKLFVDKEVTPCNWLAPVGNEWRTGIFRVTKAGE